jgi:DNA-binding LacI/PurR family transcriptional regulator
MAAMTNRRPTSADVARLAGVSRSTVSYILSGNKDQTFPEATRAKVWDAAARLSYTRNAAASALRAGQSNLVLLVVRDIPFGRNLGLAIDRLALLFAQRGMSLVTWQSTEGQSFNVTLGHLQARLVLSIFALDPAEARALEVAGIPHGALTPVPGVSSEDELTGAMQVHNLAERGYHMIGHLGAADPDLQAFAGPRRTGVRRGCLEMGLPAPLEADVLMAGGPVEDVRSVLQTWISRPDPVDGLACYNDQVGAMAMMALSQMGIPIPAQVGVIGVDDDPMSAWLNPPLSTVRLNMATVADRLLALGIAAMDGNQQPPPTTSPTIELVARESTARPRAEALSA